MSLYLSGKSSWYMGGYTKNCKKQINAVMAMIMVVSLVKSIMFYPLFLQ